MSRAAQLGLAAALGACGGEPAVELPTGCELVPGNAVAAAFGPRVDALLIGDGLGSDARIVVRRDVPGFVYALAPELAAGWANLAESRSFRDAWSSRPDQPVVPDSWVYADLQALVDHLLANIDPRAGELVQPLGLASLEWLIAAVRNTGNGGTAVDGLLRSSGGETGVVAMLGGSPSPSLLGAPAAGERVRIELRAAPDAAHRTLESWLVADDGATGMSIRDAVFGAFGEVARRLLMQVDGRASVVADADGRLVVAVGLLAPADTRDELDRLLGRDGPDAWSAPGGRTAFVEGDRLLVVDDGFDAIPDPGGPVGDAVFEVELAVPGSPRGRLEVRRRDARTLAIRARLH